MKKSKNWFAKIPLLLKIIVIVALVGLGWFGYTKFFKSQTTATQYQTSTVTRGTIVNAVSGTGQVSSANNTPVVTQVTGTITKVYVKNGDTVVAGAPIATVQLDQSSQQKYIQGLSNYQSAQNNLASAKSTQTSLRSTMITAEDNFQKNAIDKGKDSNSSTYQELKSTMKAAEEKYDTQEDVITQSQTALNNSSMTLRQVSPTIYAPISGVISGLAYQEGSVIPAQAVSASSSNQVTSQNIANITTSSIPIVTLDLTEIDIPNVKIGNKATVTFDAFPDKTFTGTVFAINTTGSVSSGVTTYPTTVTLDTENTSIYPNMSASANILIASKENVLMVPTSAVQTQDGQNYVRVLKNNQVQNVNVTTGISSDTDTEIVSGLNEGDEIVTAVVQSKTGTTSTTSSPFGTLRVGGGGNSGFVGR
jgi:RND family efflux transporter MFP subunit